MRRTGLLLMTAMLGAAADSYVASVEAWRSNREKRLKADDGWLTVAGLFWLKEGRNTFGTEASNDIVLPKDSAPAKAGVLEHHGGRTILRLFREPPATVEMKPDSQGEPTVVTLNDLSLLIIKRGPRYGLRLRDKNSEFRRKFTHIESYAVDPKYLVEARFTAYNPPKKMVVPSVIGQDEEFTSPGYVEFELNGQKCRLQPADDGGRLFLIFRDATTGKTTYPAGRFLYADPPKDGRVTLDFNKAYNPPCAFTPYATCPLPPKENRLTVAIAAGEKTYHIE